MRNKTMKKMRGWKVFPICLVLTACSAGVENSGPQAAAGYENLLSQPETGTVDERREALLELNSQLQGQMPGYHFTEMTEEELAPHTENFADSYVFCGWKTDGAAYILGKNIKEENPLEGLTCASAPGDISFYRSQFQDGDLLLMEGADNDLSLAPLYKYLDMGKEGELLLSQLARLNASVFPPREAACVKVTQWMGGKRMVYYGPLEEDVYLELSGGEPLAPESYGYADLGIYQSGQEINQTNVNGGGFVTGELLSYLETRYGYDLPGIPELTGTTVATMTSDRWGGEIKKVSDPEELEEMVRILEGAVPAGGVYDDMSAVLVLQRTDGSRPVFYLGEPENPYLVFGNGSSYAAEDGGVGKIWEMFE